jgi:hypothetical protein
MLQALCTLIGSLTGLTAKALCPDPSRHESALDCPWAEVTRAVEGIEDPVRIREVIETKIPGFLRQLEADHDSHQMFQLWGLSRNIDESQLQSGQKTVPANLLRTFDSIWNVGFDGSYTHGHAGLTHTYGYLFSNLETPFGYKRARYVRNEIEAGFGLPTGFFSGRPPKGTLFSNLTVFAGKIAFRDHERATKLLDEVIGYLGKKTPPELLSYSYGRLRVKRLVEFVRTDAFTLELRTDIVPFVNPVPGSRNSALLIYSLDYRKDTKERSRPRLITVFPVDAGFHASLFKPEHLGEKKPVKLKYNAIVHDGLPSDLQGRRIVTE